MSDASDRSPHDQAPRARCHLALIVALGSAACSDSGAAATTDDSSGGAVDSDDDSAGSDVGATPAARGCPPPEGVSARPESIEEVVALLGALPLPTTLPCFLESLERPLAIAVTTNDFSAQPADGPESPRMFIVSGPLTMSVVPTGIGRNLLEFAVDVGNRESVKAELSFPLTERVTDADPYDHVRGPGGGTSCNGCHAGERLSDEIDVAEAYISEALQPPEEEQYSIGFVQQVAGTCDPDSGDERCAMLTAVFAHGDVTNVDFPPDNRICRSP